MDAVLKLPGINAAIQNLREADKSKCNEPTVTESLQEVNKHSHSGTTVQYHVHESHFSQASNIADEFSDEIGSDIPAPSSNIAVPTLSNHVSNNRSR
ncbi:hypothetical protein [Wolbachia endosymbiont of Cantharis cryptica]|uniref:hypothetical protein n=1 Tax=Wolbachia endosymbiont of Cantharis cryptica TaxID=3066132 RepID=UPI00376F2E56